LDRSGLFTYRVLLLEICSNSQIVPRKYLDDPNNSSQLLCQT